MNAVYHTEELPEMLSQWKPSVIYLLEGGNSDRYCLTPCVARTECWRQESS